MRMEPCECCNKQISRSAPSCPLCGQPHPHEKKATAFEAQIVTLLIADRRREAIMLCISTDSELSEEDADAYVDFLKRRAL
jgi:predicted amidophosphoribosyltransferase